MRDCGLYKFWFLGSLRENPRLLQLPVDYWEPDSETFKLYGTPLSIEVEDIYFIIGLSCRGEVVNLQSHGPQGRFTIYEYIAVYCVPDMENIGSRIPINLIKKSWVEGHTVGIGKDSGIGISPPRFKAFDVLYSGVHVSYYV